MSVMYLPISVKAIFCVLLVCNYLTFADGSGALIRPRHRGIVWTRVHRGPTPYSYMGQNCGGIATLRRNGGKCGLCGDSYSGSRDHEIGGRYSTGTVSRNYAADQRHIETKVVLNTFYGGYFEFRLCDANGEAETQECFDRHVLQVVEGQDQGDGTRYRPRSAGLLTLNLEIPQGVKCTRCVLQWKYKSAGHFGKGADGRGCIGCGQQEEFYNCADIAIEGWKSPVEPPSPQVHQSPIVPQMPVVTQSPVVSDVLQSGEDAWTNDTVHFVKGNRLDIPRPMEESSDGPPDSAPSIPRPPSRELPTSKDAQASSRINLTIPSPPIQEQPPRQPWRVGHNHIQRPSGHHEHGDGIIHPHISATNLGKSNATNTKNETDFTLKQSKSQINLTHLPNRPWRLRHNHVQRLSLVKQPSEGPAHTHQNSLGIININDGTKLTKANSLKTASTQHISSVKTSIVKHKTQEFHKSVHINEVVSNTDHVHGNIPPPPIVKPNNNKQWRRGHNHIPQPSTIQQNVSSTKNNLSINKHLSNKAIVHKAATSSIHQQVSGTKNGLSINKQSASKAIVHKAATSSIHQQVSGTNNGLSINKQSANKAIVHKAATSSIHQQASGTKNGLSINKQSSNKAIVHKAATSSIHQQVSGTKDGLSINKQSANKAIVHKAATSSIHQQVSGTKDGLSINKQSANKAIVHKAATSSIHQQVSGTKDGLSINKQSANKAIVHKAATSSIHQQVSGTNNGLSINKQSSNKAIIHKAATSSIHQQASGTNNGLSINKQSANKETVHKAATSSIHQQVSGTKNGLSINKQSANKAIVHKAATSSIHQQVSGTKDSVSISKQLSNKAIVHKAATTSIHQQVSGTKDSVSLSKQLSNKATVHNVAASTIQHLSRPAQSPHSVGRPITIKATMAPYARNDVRVTNGMRLDRMTLSQPSEKVRAVKGKLQARKPTVPVLTHKARLHANTPNVQKLTEPYVRLSTLHGTAAKGRNLISHAHATRATVQTEHQSVTSNSKSSVTSDIEHTQMVPTKDNTLSNEYKGDVYTELQNRQMVNRGVDNTHQRMYGPVLQYVDRFHFVDPYLSPEKTKATTAGRSVKHAATSNTAGALVIQSNNVSKYNKASKGKFRKPYPRKQFLNDARNTPGTRITRINTPTKEAFTKKSSTIHARENPTAVPYINRKSEGMGLVRDPYKTQSKTHRVKSSKANAIVHNTMSVEAVKNINEDTHIVSTAKLSKAHKAADTEITKQQSNRTSIYKSAATKQTFTGQKTKVHSHSISKTQSTSDISRGTKWKNEMHPQSVLTRMLKHNKTAVNQRQRRLKQFTQRTTNKNKSLGSMLHVTTIDRFVDKLYNNMSKNNTNKRRSGKDMKLVPLTRDSILNILRDIAGNRPIVNRNDAHMRVRLGKQRPKVDLRRMVNHGKVGEVRKHQKLWLPSRTDKAMSNSINAEKMQTSKRPTGQSKQADVSSHQELSSLQAGGLGLTTMGRDSKHNERKRGPQHQHWRKGKLESSVNKRTRMEPGIRKGMSTFTRRNSIGGGNDAPMVKESSVKQLTRSMVNIHVHGPHKHNTQEIQNSRPGFTKTDSSIPKTGTNSHNLPTTHIVKGHSRLQVANSNSKAVSLQSTQSRYDIFQKATQTGQSIINTIQRLLSKIKTAKRLTPMNTGKHKEVVVIPLKPSVIKAFLSRLRNRRRWSSKANTALK